MARDNRNDDDSDDRPRRRGPDDDNDRYDRDRRQPASRESQPTTKSMSLLGLFSMLLGIGSLVVSFIPCVGMFAIGGGGGALLLGVIGLAVAGKYNHGKGMAIAGVIVSILSIVVASLWLLLFAGMGKIANDMEKEREAEYAAKETADAIKVHSIKLLNEYMADEGAIEKYSGKLVEVTGTVQRVIKDNPSVVTVRLGDKKSIVGCEFVRRNEQVTGLETGATVVIRGNLTTRGYGVILLQACLLMPNAIPTEKPKTIVVKAATLASDYASDAEIADKMYRGQALELSGEMEKATVYPNGSAVVWLKAGKDTEPIRCDFEEKTKNLPKETDVGKPLKILGVCIGNKGDKITLKGCIIVE